MTSAAWCTSASFIRAALDGCNGSDYSCLQDSSFLISYDDAVSVTDGFNRRGKMMQPIRSYIHAQGVAAAVINAVLNPAITWLGNRRMAFVPLTGDNSIIVDIAVTSIVLSLLVSLFITPAAQREFRAGRLTGSATDFAESGALAHLPSKAWSFGCSSEWSPPLSLPHSCSRRSVRWGLPGSLLPDLSFSKPSIRRC